VGAEYTVLEVRPQHHANGSRLEDLVAVDRSGRLWSPSMFRRRQRKTDIGFAYEILNEVRRTKPAPAVRPKLNDAEPHQPIVAGIKSMPQEH
jgi:hypothetical protein